MTAKLKKGMETEMENGVTLPESGGPNKCLDLPRNNFGSVRH